MVSTTAQRHQTLKALCLKTTPLRETDALAWFYTPEGMVHVSCRGVRKPNSKLAGACQPFVLNNIQLVAGKTVKSLPTLTGYQHQLAFEGIAAHLAKTAIASTWLDIVSHLAEDVDAHQIFELLLSCLSALSQASNDELELLATTIQFQLPLLDIVGYQLPVETCVVSHEPLTPEDPMTFNWALGGFVSADVHSQLPQAQRSQSVKTSLATWQALNQPHQLANIEGLNVKKLHRFFFYIWQHRLERNLQSVSVFEQLMP